MWGIGIEEEGTSEVCEREPKRNRFLLGLGVIPRSSQGLFLVLWVGVTFSGA